MLATAKEAAADIDTQLERHVEPIVLACLTSF
jgi:hypothetical protein